MSTHERPIFAALISRKWRVPSRIQKSQSPLDLNRSTNGFILLEVLVAMSLVASSWVGLSNTYQGMILRLGQIQEKRTELRKEMDRHEIAILTAAQLNKSNQISRKLANESLGMPRRPLLVSNSGRTTHKK